MISIVSGDPKGNIKNEDILTKTNFIIDPDNNVNSIAVQNSVDSRDCNKIDL